MEFLGANILTGFNLDMRLNKNRNDGIGFRVGTGFTIGAPSDPDRRGSLGMINFPLEINRVFGERKNAFVLGLGLIPIVASKDAQSTISIDGRFARIDEGLSILGGFMSMGYRYQPIDSGFMFQIHYNPTIFREAGLASGWFGIGLGYGFK